MKAVKGVTRSRADKAFDVMDYILLTIGFLMVAYPLYFVLIASISDPIAVYEGRVILYPIKPTLEGYERIFSYESLFIGYKNTLIYTLVGTSINVVLTITAGYALSRRDQIRNDHRFLASAADPVSLPAEILRAGRYDRRH